MTCFLQLLPVNRKICSSESNTRMNALIMRQSRARSSRNALCKLVIEIERLVTSLGWVPDIEALGPSWIPDRTKTQGLKITQENVLLLLSEFLDLSDKDEKP